MRKLAALLLGAAEPALAQQAGPSGDEAIIVTGVREFGAFRSNAR